MGLSCHHTSDEETLAAYQVLTEKLYYDLLYVICVHLMWDNFRMALGFTGHHNFTILHFARFKIYFGALQVDKQNVSNTILVNLVNETV